jgi:hypothetical protein
VGGRPRLGTRDSLTSRRGNAVLISRADFDALEDEMQIAVLRFLLDPRPAPVTLDEILTEFIGLDDGTFSERDRIRNAVRDLACAGLAHRHGEFVMPSRAAVRFSELAGR